MNQLRTRFRCRNAQISCSNRIDFICSVPFGLTGVHRRVRRTVNDCIWFYLSRQLHNLVDACNIKFPYVCIDKLKGIISCIQLIHGTPQLSVASRYDNLLHRLICPPFFPSDFNSNHTDTLHYFIIHPQIHKENLERIAIFESIY